MGIFKLRKNKRFDYTPRYYKKEGDGSPFEIKRKFDEYRTTAGGQGGLKTRFNNAMDDLKGNPDRAVNRRVLFIVLILILIFLFIIDFDLSIFFR
ncbi:MAG: riboflavin synthase subunit beta [Flavobacteriaceae bacterium]|nr:riboflavin synthase subunit beta [Bacteroidia bacterium]MBT8287008.1 riboflavin synthase subunit beta [Bacteroidia bacterium]NNF75811.1 riboflavin synthase subunit beta [Flavobacteriaceae bacterium]NNK71654.1 riboflavin synthase subunit beta [Flavobacteriaceae bacterium]